MSAQTDERAARVELRRQTREVLRDPDSVAAHLARMAAALALPGSEPAQGALADMFHRLGPGAGAMKRAALQMAAPSLADHVRRSFEVRVDAQALPQVTPLATRWSVVAVPSADVSTRARRVSADDSRALAADIGPAVLAGDMAAQEVFLDHCMTCKDALAFMLASRAARKAGVELSAAWADVGAALEKAVEVS